jgi:YHS domain-containing protein
MNRYDVGSRFARVHLSTRAERAAYLLLRADRNRSWTAEEIARLKHIELADIERALVGFSSAGLVDVHDEEPVRYRWSADIDSLLGGIGGGAEYIDPVCGMGVSADTSYVTADAEGNNVWFCSSLCRAAFIGFPSSFVSRGPQETISTSLHEPAR